MLGPDYFYGVHVQDLPADRDKATWAHEARVKALEVFPKWFDAVKATYGERHLNVLIFSTLTFSD